MKIFRRDKLRRLIAKGGVTLAESYHYDDMMGSERRQIGAEPRLPR